MVQIKRREVDTSLEQKIVMGMIVSTKFLKEVYPSIQLQYIRSNFAKTIAGWVIDYYEEYEEAPSSHIQDIFDFHSPNLDKSEREMIEKLLLQLSQKYEAGEEVFNFDYLANRSRELFTKRELEIRSNNIQILLEQGKIKEAESEITKYKGVAKVVSDWVNPKEEIHMKEALSDIERTFFRFPGNLGRFIGNLEPGYFVAAAGAFKKGKTWFLQEIAIIGALSNLNAVMFNLEMPTRKLNERVYKRISGSGTEDFTKGLFPCFDCLSHQEGSCEKEERIDNISLRSSSGRKPSFRPGMDYQPCTWCRGVMHHQADYRPATWFEEIDKPPFDFQEVNKAMKTFPDRIRIKNYPRFSANVSDLTRDLDLLEYVEGFVPHIIIIDYADILKPEDSRVTGVEQLDQTWKTIARLGAERNALIVTVTQVTREALEKAHLKSSHTAGWIGKLAHVDLMITLNQTDLEKLEGLMRVGIIAHRHEEFDPNTYCWILQNIRFGQIHLDSQIVHARKEE